MFQEHFDVVVIGAGPAGLTAAYFLAKKGFDVVVLERGPEVGSKNVFGGRIYSYVLDKHFPGWRGEAPVERWVRSERLTFLCEASNVTLEFRSHRGLNGHDSFTAFLSKFLKWLASKVEEQGGMVATGVLVESLIYDSGAVRGVVAGGDRLKATYTLIAEGANTVLLERHGIRPAPEASKLAVGIKEVIRLGERTISERLGLEPWEGVAQLFVGHPIKGVIGGGFLYTMGDYISIGLVVRLSEFARTGVKASEIIEEFRFRPELRRLLKGGTVVEYSAHLIREGGALDVLEKPYGNGYLVLGDAAGFTISTGFTARGVDLAMESGRLAAVAVERAHAQGRSDASTLSEYGKLLADSPVMRSLRKYKRAVRFLENRRLYDVYPEVLCSILGRVYGCDEEPTRVWEAVKVSSKGRASLPVIVMDVIRAVTSL